LSGGVSSVGVSSRVWVRLCEASKINTTRDWLRVSSQV
jgi:hypothetical protein